MPKQTTKLLLLILALATKLPGQNSEINGLIKGELQMSFPSIYFKHSSTDYAVMPYSVDSCFKYIAANIKDLNSYAIWRDLAEKERLTYFRVKQLKLDLNKYLPANKIRFQSMGLAQKVSRQTIGKSVDDKQTQYLLSLNSVLDVSGAIEHKKNNYTEKKQRKGLPRLVWCGWQYGFHWSTPGKPHASTTNTATKSRSTKTSHVERPRVWCLKCWKNHRFSKDYRRLNAVRNNGANTSTDK